MVLCCTTLCSLFRSCRSWSQSVPWWKASFLRTSTGSTNKNKFTAAPHLVPLPQEIPHRIDSDFQTPQDQLHHLLDKRTQSLDNGYHTVPSHGLETSICCFQLCLYGVHLKSDSVSLEQFLYRKKVYRCNELPSSCFFLPVRAEHTAESCFWK